MKKFIITLIAVAVLGLTPAVAQHASAEPTAKTENAGKSGKKSPGSRARNRVAKRPARKPLPSRRPPSLP